jgi:hypothetical protein
MRALLAITATVCILNLASVSAQAQSVCNTHHLGYTQSECNRCTNMKWSVSRVFPRGVCVSNGTTTCTLTRWGGATLPLRAPNFSGTGASISVCRNGYDLSKSQLTCSSGSPARAFNYPNTNVTCNGAGGVGANVQVMINGTPCCI